MSKLYEVHYTSTPSDKKNFWGHAVAKPKTGFANAQPPILDIPQKNLGGGHLHRFLRKKNDFHKNPVEVRRFDGTFSQTEVDNGSCQKNIL